VKSLLHCLLVLVLFGLPGRAPSSRLPVADARATVWADSQASLIAARYGMRLGRRVSPAEVRLPRRFDRLPWVQYQDACLSAGYDLRRVAGDTVTFATYRVTFEGVGEGQRLCLILKPDEVVGAFVYAVDEVGGVYPLTDNPWRSNPGGVCPPDKRIEQTSSL
jgi:hypothetical protein